MSQHVLLWLQPCKPTCGATTREESIRRCWAQADSTKIGCSLKSAVRGTVQICRPLLLQFSMESLSLQPSPTIAALFAASLPSPRCQNSIQGTTAHYLLVCGAAASEGSIGHVEYQPQASWQPRKSCPSASFPGGSATNLTEARSFVPRKKKKKVLLTEIYVANIWIL